MSVWLRLGHSSGACIGQVTLRCTYHELLELLLGRFGEAAHRLGRDELAVNLTQPDEHVLHLIVERLGL